MIMLPDYNDIRALTDQPPLWHDGDGVPRYAPFHPDMLGVYDRFAILAEIACQPCHQLMVVGCGWTHYDFHQLASGTGEVRFRSLEELAAGFVYGDPPRHDCVGDSMSSESVRIVEAWDRTTFEWVRRPELELDDIAQDWAREDAGGATSGELDQLATGLGLSDTGPVELP